MPRRAGNKLRMILLPAARRPHSGRLGTQELASHSNSCGLMVLVLMSQT